MAAVHRRLKRIEVYCPEYETTATIRINDAHSSGTDPELAGLGNSDLPLRVVQAVQVLERRGETSQVNR